MIICVVNNCQTFNKQYKMFTKLCIALLLMSSLAYVQAESQCPKDCTCGQNSLSNIMECTVLPTEPITTSLAHFAIKNAAAPLHLTSEIFTKLGLEHVSSISIANSTIVSIDKAAFHNLTELTTVQLAHVTLVSLHRDTFKHNLNLNKLNLSGNPLDINRLVSSNSIEQLDLSGCNIQAINTNVFRNISKLNYLDLSNNDIETIAVDSFVSLEDLTEINLSKNKLKQLKKNTFTKNVNLEILNLSSNPLVSFTNVECENLAVLNLQSCLLQKIETNTFEHLKELRNLDLNDNRIDSIELTSFQNLRELNAINLSGNKLTVVDDHLFMFNKKLRKIALDNLKLTKFPVNGFQVANGSFDTYYLSCNNCNLQSLSKHAFKHMPALVSLFLSNNQITDISTGLFQNLIGLNELDLSSNQISTIDDATFESNSNLNTLNLSNNPLKSLHASTFAANENLKFLDLNNCGLFTLWSKSTGELRLPSIVSLNISHNHINIITKDDISVTSGLKTLDVSENPFDCEVHLKNLIEYLEEKDIKNGKYLTHEEMDHEYFQADDDSLEWRELGKSRCPTLFKAEDEYAEDELDDDYSYSNGDFTDLDEYVTETEINSRVFVVDELEKDKNKIVMTLHHYRYTYWWPILVFIGTAMIVLGTVANIILCVIRRRQSFTIPNIINVSNMPKIKNNSGLVYHKLSEEHVPNIIVKQ